MSATATINSRASAHPSAKSIPGLPATSRLLPRAGPEENGNQHPPIYMKLNTSILSLLAESPSPPKISLELSDKTKALRIGNYEYQGSIYKEPGFLEVYLPDNTRTESHEHLQRFRSHGQVRSRITIRQDKPLKLARSSSAVDLAQPTEQRIMQLLALGPVQAQDLATKSQASRELVDAVLAKVAEPRANGSPLYVLKGEFQSKSEAKGNSRSLDRPDSKPASRPSSRPVSRTENRLDFKSDGTSEAAPVKPERVTKTLKELREERAQSQGSDRGSMHQPLTTAPFAAARSSMNQDARVGGAASSALSPNAPNLSPNLASGDDSRSDVKRAMSVPPELSNREEALKTTSFKRRAPSPLEKSKRSRTEVPEGLPNRPAVASVKRDGEEDMFEIARKFKSAYGEYLELYSLLSKHKARPPSQVEKLMAMHRQLECWKTTLWTNARNKRMVN